MRKRQSIVPMVAALATIFAMHASAQTVTPNAAQKPPTALATQPDMAIDAVTRSKVIATIAQKLRDNYVFPEVAEKLANALLASDKRGEFQHLQSANAFAEAVNLQLHAIGKDKHFRLRFSPSPVEEDIPQIEKAKQKPSAAQHAKELEVSRWRNFGIEKYERLPGNIALLELNGFLDAGIAGEALAAAMSLACGAQALIIDLRKNGGGDPATVALISSYLFDAEPVHLNDLYYRFNNQTQQYWTHAYVPGKRFGADKPVYVLTSKHTFSAAEEFSNNLKTLKRATIIGETTGGGANPGDVFKAGEHFSIFISTGRAINPITKSNWEGVGVIPDIAVPEEQALLTAQIKAMGPVISAIPEAWRQESLKKVQAQLQEKLASLKNSKLAQK